MNTSENNVNTTNPTDFSMGKAETVQRYLQGLKVLGKSKKKQHRCISRELKLGQRYDGTRACFAANV